jgi:hypothetical protein
MIKIQSLALAAAMLIAVVADASAFTRSGSVTGPAGRTATYGGSTTCTGGTCSSQGGVTGPRGNTITRSGTWQR